MPFELPEDRIRDCCHFRGKMIRPIAAVCSIRCCPLADWVEELTTSILETIEDCSERNPPKCWTFHRLADSAGSGAQRRAECWRNGPIGAALNVRQVDPSSEIN